MFDSACRERSSMANSGSLAFTLLPIWTKTLETMPAICVPIEMFSVLASTMPEPATEAR